MAFQKIKPYSPDRNSSLNSGWIHTDGARTFLSYIDTKRTNIYRNDYLQIQENMMVIQR